VPRSMAISFEVNENNFGNIISPNGFLIFLDNLYKRLLKQLKR